MSDKRSAANRNEPNKAYVAAIFERLPEDWHSRTLFSFSVSLFGWMAGSSTKQFIDREFFADEQELCEVYGFCGDVGKQWGEAQGADVTEVDIRDHGDRFESIDFTELGLDMVPFALAAICFIAACNNYNSVKKGTKNIINSFTPGKTAFV